MTTKPVKRTQAQLIQKHLADAAAWESKSREFASKAAVAKEKAARMQREAKEAAKLSEADNA